MIHQYKLNGYNIVLDVYSASVHVTDDLAYDAIHLIDSGMSILPGCKSIMADRSSGISPVS